MHTRRAGALLIGAWLLGTALMWFVSHQSLANVDRLMLAPPVALTTEIDSMGHNATRLLLRHQAMQFIRHVTEAWEYVQLGLVAALLATTILTIHRSRFLTAASFLMLLIIAAVTFLITPYVHSLGRELDFLPAGMGAPQRESLQALEVWRRVLEVLKLGIGLAVAGRLVIDLHQWSAKLAPAQGTRRRRTHPADAVQGGQSAEN